MASSFSELQQLAGQWRARNFPRSESVLSARDTHLMQQVLGVGEEAGELAHAVLKMTQGIRGTREEHMAAAQDAVGDIVIYLTGVCDDLGISFHQAVNEAWQQVSERDWVKNPTDGSK